MSEAELAAAIARLEELDLEGLRAEWARHHGAPLALRSVPILRMKLAWRLQCEVLGGLDPATRRALARKGRVRAEGLGLGPGTRLTRVWQGKVHEVMVEPDGFRWEGQVWRSLSAVASAIAGSRWNGPRFFGLRR
jgi:hypothetical protein